ncbi:hypothetical protein SAMN05421594_0421 [Chryseobacterium oleae]|uniref:Uncharacterized protein n=1 Tax=Chryseobacterium oleae TaxID=491207 RepID=A0A1I4VLR4_CHROL|nr:hypothetical protein [Chryseobacterium oleae]SFN02181.1 hypothetical protein SAMN05421594_0421 [Chryseobacterium oleae]
MKKIFTILLGLSIGSAAFAQNGSGTLHVFNDDSYHSLNLHYTLFTVNLSQCGDGYQALGPSIPLPPGVITDYTTFLKSSSFASSPHPYPIDSYWHNSTVVPATSISPAVADAQRWSYMKFELRDPNNPGLMNPTLGGSVGFYPTCTGIPNYISGTSTLNGINYAFKAEAVTFGGDLWINVW